MKDIPQAFAFKLALACLVLVFLTRMLPPHPWIITHYLFSYEFGFQRRGAFGELLSVFIPGNMTRTAVYTVAATLTVTSGIALFAFLARRFRPLEGRGWILLLFVTSIGFGAFVGNTGYLGTVLLVITLGALALPATTVGFLGRLAAVVLGPLIHETMLPYFTLLIAYEYYLRHPAPPLRRIAPVGILIVASAISVILLFRYGGHHYSDAWWVLFNLEVRSVNFDVFENALEPVVDYPSGTDGPSEFVWTSPFYYFRIIFFGAVGAVVIGLHLWRLQIALAHRAVLERIAVSAAILAPVSLVLVAFDISRFLAIAMINLFLVIAIHARFDPAFATTVRKGFTVPFIIAMLVLNGHFALRDLNASWSPNGRFPGTLVPMTGWFVHPDHGEAN